MLVDDLKTQLVNIDNNLYISSRNLFVPSYMDSYIGFRYLKSL